MLLLPMLKREKIIVERVWRKWKVIDIDLKSKFSCDNDFISKFKEEWIEVANLLKQYIKEEQENEEQCI